MPRNAKALCFALATVLSWSTVSTAFKLALKSLSPMQMTAVAMGTAALALVPFAALEARSLAARGRIFTPRRTGLAVLAGAVIFLYYLVLFHGYDHLPAQVAQPVNYTWSIMLAILLSLVRRTPLRPRQILWMCVAWAGTAVIAMGLCGELAHDRLSALDGNSSYRNYIIDAVYNLTAEQLKEGARYEMR